MFQKGDPFQGAKGGSCLTLGNELSQETRAEKARDFIGKGCPGRGQEGKGTQEDCSVMWLRLGFYGDGIIFWVVANQSFWLRVFLGDTRIAQARWTPVRRILGGDRTCASPLTSLLAGGGLLAPCSLLGPPVVK